MNRSRLLQIAGGLFAVYTGLLVVACVAQVVTAGRSGSDFWTFWQSGRDVLHGHSPYPALGSLPQHATRTFAPFVYPPIAAFWMAPFSLLPFAAANVLYLVVNLAAVGLSLRLLGVRDRRCFCIAYSSAPVFAAIGLGTVSPLLLLGVTAAWRFRHRAIPAGLLVAAVVTMKLFLWPLGLWLLATRRWRAAAAALAAGMLAIVGSWAMIGFAGLRDYPALLGRLTELVGPHSYSVYALARLAGAGSAAAQAGQLLAVVAALTWATRRLRRDRELFFAAIGVALLATPILWPHYLVLLFVVVGLMAPSLSPLWIAPLALWIDAAAWNEGSTVRVAALLATAGAVVALGLLRRPARPAVAPPAMTAAPL